jgi:hypothetical protein
VAHGFTSIAESDTYGVFRKADGATGGLMTYSFRTDNYSYWVRGVVSLETAIKTSAGVAPIIFEGVDTDGGTSIQGLPANSNIVAIRNYGVGTVWIADADGDTWQSGTLTAEGVDHYLGTASLASNLYLRFSTDANLWELYADRGGTGFGIYDRTGTNYPMFFQDDTKYCVIGDTANTTNSKMTAGLTLRQGAADDEILAFKSSDVAHGYTTGAETDTYATFLKVYGDYGGLKIFGYADNHASASQALQLNAYGAQASATKSTAAVGLITMYATQHDGANALADVTANGNIVAIRARVSSAWSTCWILDEDGDTWQSGVATTALGGIQFTRVEERIYSSANTHIHIDIGGSERHRFSEYELHVGSGLGAGNANMQSGITIWQGGYDTEILAFKSSDVAHALTSVAETNTYVAFSKRAAATGGLDFTVLAQDGAFNDIIRFELYGSQMDITKGATALGGFHILVTEHDNANAVANVTDSGNVFTIAARVSGANRTVFIVDEDGDFHYDGADQGAYDDHNDALVCRDLNMTLSSRGEQFLKYNKDALVAMGVVSPELYVSGKNMNMLQLGAISQLYDRINILEGELKQLREERING